MCVLYPIDWVNEKMIWKSNGRLLAQKMHAFLEWKLEMARVNVEGTMSVELHHSEGGGKGEGSSGTILFAREDNKENVSPIKWLSPVLAKFDADILQSAESEKGGGDACWGESTARLAGKECAGQSARRRRQKNDGLLARKETNKREDAIPEDATSTNNPGREKMERGVAGAVLGENVMCAIIVPLFV